MNYSHLPEISCVYSEITRLHSFELGSQSPMDLAEAHFEYEMILVTKGGGRAVIGASEYPIQKGSLIFINRFERHHFVIGPERYERFIATMSSGLILSGIRETELIAIFTQRPSGFRHVIQLDEEAFQLLLPYFQKLTDEYARQDDFYVAKSLSILTSLLIDLYRNRPEAFIQQAAPGMTSIVVEVQRYINDHYPEKITLQQIADEHFISRRALSDAFKDLVGLSFRDYLIRFRMAEARKLLMTTDLSVEEVSERVGYENVNNFIQIFKKTNSLTPLQFRKSISLLSK